MIPLRAALLSMLLIVPGGWAEAATTKLESVTTPRGVKQAFLLIKPDKPVASVILFAGGHGALGLTGASSMRWGEGNFLVRMRQTFAGHDLMVAVADAPSDHQSGMDAIFRMSGKHAEDIGSVVEYLKKEADVPVWVVGTSMGTFSAAGGAIGAKGVDGLVLTSTITRSDPSWAIRGSHPDAVASMALGKVHVPTYILSHRHDSCPLTPAGDAAKLTSRLTAAKPVEAALIDGGPAPRSTPCEAYAQHGFFGVEKEAVDKIVAFVKANSR
jgi:pimeloyl-ACP methyl ester carboxylesterase